MAIYSLEDICEFITDGTHQTPEYCEDGGYLFLSSKDVTSRKIDWDHAKRIPEELHNKLYMRLSPQRNDILLAKNGTTGVAALVDKDVVFDVYVSLAVLRPKKTVFPPYLLQAINSQSVKRQFDAGLKGIGVPNLHLGVIRKALVNIPAWNEQLEINERLETISRIIEYRKKQLNALDTLIKARFVEMFEQGTFEEVEFGDICVFLRNGANIKQTKGASGIPITRIETLSNDVFNIDRLGYADIFEIGKYLSYRLQTGDILISHINSVAYLGRAVQYRGQLGDKPIIHGMNLLCARIIDSYNPTYVEYFFRTPSAKDYISTITKKAVNQASITTTDLRRMKIPSPSIEKQNQFAAFVSQVDKSKVAVQKSLNEAQLLFDSLMQKYFG